MKSAIVIFPGSSGENDVFHILNNVLDERVDLVWHKMTNLDDYDLVILPGGSSYGDYIRPGAMARYSPIMKALGAFAKEGKYILGIGNGWQMLLEMNLLPGAVLKNTNLKFICSDTFLKVENNTTLFTNAFEDDEVIRLPIANGFGNYFCDEPTLQELLTNQQIVLRYCAADGKLTSEANYSGSTANIAGIINQEGNILGMMPHPERYSEDILGGKDGLKIFTSIINKLKGVNI